jgi:hypothetical protein
MSGARRLNARRIMMKLTSVVLGLFLTAGLSHTGSSAPVSDLSGIHAVIEKVVFEPSEAAPERVQIWGAFIILSGTTPTRGYLYLGLPAMAMYCPTCPSPENANEFAKKEWADLKSVAGTGQGVAFGYRFFQGRLRPLSEKPQSPDRYPVFMGVAKMGNHPQVEAMNRLLQGR